ncbi:hypothetical protein DFH06DRAFT_1439812 [Mycena polygramma]|nr:hypothetical protein DFH06DRAFT_1439812 [Mycena polygramma]
MAVPVPPGEHLNGFGSDGEPERESRFPGAEVEDPEFEELTSEDFPTYFSERDGRLFHSHGSSPYPLPVDTPEQERMNAQHYALFELLGGHYPASCPVSEGSRSGPRETEVCVGFVHRDRKMICEIHSFLGRTMDVAQDFPHVAFRGLDIVVLLPADVLQVPIATRYPHPNVQFSMHDVNTPTVWVEGTFDFIHARSVTMAVTSYPALLIEVARLLRPRGLFLSGEWGRYPGFHPSYAPRTPATDTPALTAFFAHLHAALMARGLHPVSPPIAPLLAQSGAFDEIAVREYHMPLGPWHPEPAMKALGLTFRTAYLRYMNSVRPMLEESGISAQVLDDMYVRAEREVRDNDGLIAVFNTVHAKKV